MTEFDDTLLAFVESVNEIWRYTTEDVRLERLNKAQQQADQLRQADVKSLDGLLDLLRDTQADLQVRYAACEVLVYLVRKDPPAYRRSKGHRVVDRRRALQPLLAALHSDDSTLRWGATYLLGLLHNKGAVVALLKVALEDSDSRVRCNALMSLGMLGDQRATNPLLALVKNRQAEHNERQAAIVALGDIGDTRATSPLITLMLDKSEDEQLRGEAAERLSYFGREELIPPYITALRDEAAGVRFRAAYGLTCLYCDISAALPDLDRLVAYDTVVPIGWWAVGREAIPALENIWYSRRLSASGGEKEDYYMSSRTYLISPTLEYWDYMQKTTVWQGSTPVFVPLNEPITLQLDPAWLAEQIKANWPAARINVREPRPEALLLDWEIDMAEGLLMGGLHRDKYCVILTGKDDDVEQFATWYRRIIPAQHKLLLYGWADPGEEIKLADA